MQVYKITEKSKIESFAKRKINVSIKILIGIYAFLFSISIFRNKEEIQITTLVFVFLFIGVLFYFMFLHLKKLMKFMGKNISYTLTETNLLFKYNLDDEKEMGFFENYLYKSGKRKGGYKDYSIEFDKMKSISKNNKGDLILITSSLLMRKIIIPREIENLRDMENQIRTKIKR